MTIAELLPRDLGKIRSRIVTAFAKKKVRIFLRETDEDGSGLSRMVHIRDITQLHRVDPKWLIEDLLNFGEKCLATLDTHLHLTTGKHIGAELE